MQEFDHNRNYLYRCFRWLTNEIVKNQLQGKTNVEEVLNKFYDTVSNHISDFYIMTEEEMLEEYNDVITDEQADILRNSSEYEVRFFFGELLEKLLARFSE